MLDYLQDVWHNLIHWLTTGKPINKIRMVAGTMMFVFGMRYWYMSKIRVRRRTKEEDEELNQEIYEKDENGKYPWEVDTDLSADNIPEDASAFQQDNWRPRRGRWKI